MMWDSRINYCRGWPRRLVSMSLLKDGNRSLEQEHGLNLKYMSTKVSLNIMLWDEPHLYKLTEVNFMP